MAASVNTLRQTLTEIIRDLTAYGVKGTLVGGLAVSIRAEPRFTRDADIVISVEDDAAAERLIYHLQGCGYRILAVLERTLNGRLSTVRLTPPEGRGGRNVIDLLFASCGIEKEISEDAEEIEIFSGLSLPVARSGHLLAMKLLAHDVFNLSV